MIEDDDGVLFLSFFPFFFFEFYHKTLEKEFTRQGYLFYNAIDNRDGGKQNGSQSDSIFLERCDALHWMLKKCGAHER